MPVIDPAAKVIEERSGKPKPVPEKLQITDDRMVEIFEAWRKREALKMKGLFVSLLVCLSYTDSLLFNSCFKQPNNHMILPLSLEKTR